MASAVLYPGQNFWGPSLAPSIILRGPFGIFEGHELNWKKNTTKNGLTIKFCFEHCKSHSFTLKIKTFSFCVKEQLKMSISLPCSIVREEIVSTSMAKMFENNTKTFWKVRQSLSNYWFHSESSISGKTQFISLTKSWNMPGRFCIVHKILQGGTHSAVLQSYQLLLMEQKMAYI